MNITDKKNTTMKAISTNLQKQANVNQSGTISILNREHKTVIIGSREYLAENLYCPELGFHYDNDPENSKGGYGTLHTHYAIPAITNLLPEGWRVMTDGDWDELLKITGNDQKRLFAKEFGGTNEFGFRVLPAGDRYDNAAGFAGRGSNAYFWSSSAANTPNAWGRNFSYAYATVYRNNYTRSNGFSIRCVRDLK
jgi:uncharacterized protein (TIGR02145 family)